MDHFSKKLPKTILFAAIALTILAGVFVLPVANKNNKALADTGLVGYWNFDEGTGMTVVDSSGNNSTGTLTNGPTWTPGKIGTGLSFDGVDDYVLTTVPLSGLNTFSLEAWINPAAGDNTENHIFGISGIQSWVKNGYLSFYCTDYPVQPPIPYGQWSHIVLSGDANGHYIYLNGVLVSSSTYPCNISSNSLKIGEYNNVGGGYAFNGSIDEVRIYNRAFIPSNVVYSDGTISLNSGTVTLDDIYTAVNNPAVLSKSGNEYILTANVSIGSSATLTIDAATAGGITLKFNEPSHNLYGILNSGTLSINNAIITSATGNAWYILNHNNVAAMNLNNSDVSICGQTPVPCIKFGDYNQYGKPTRKFSWNNNKFHDNLGYYILFLNYVPFWVDMTDSEFYNLTGYGIDLSRGTISNSKIHDIGITGSNILTIIAWGENNAIDGGGSVYNSEFYNINTGDLFYCKEGGGGCKFQNNWIHDVDAGVMLGVYGSQQTDAVIFSDNIIENSTVKGTPSGGLFDFRANQYLGGVNLTSQIYNNTIRNITGPLFSWHSGGQNAKIWNNTVSNVPGLGFYANYQASQAGGGTYHPGDSSGSILRDMVMNNIRIYDLDNPADQSIRGKLPPFLNVKYGTVNVDMPDDKFYDYKYLDVKVVDSNNNPINGAIVGIANNIDNTNYPSINADGTIKSSFLTGSDGHTPLPSDTTNTAAILDFYKTSTTQTEMTYTITASKDGKTASTTITPDAIWYRSNPLIPVNTITIQLPTTPIFAPLPSSSADLNSDGHVNSADFGMLMSAWGSTLKPAADLNQDGIVNSVDFGILMSQWG
ncbi:MAG: LamG-like jellyroll fold domain-containing protein [Candidatus Paceibacterota bacterium]|jgi:hypothetical protein